MQESNNFNFIRVVAAIMVVFTHTYVLLGLGASHDFLHSITHGELLISVIGLRAFFVISGYLIIQSMERSTSYKTFFLKRVKRIFPGLIVCVLVSICIVGAFATNLPLRDYFSLSKTWLYMKNISLYQLEFFLPSVFEANPVKVVNGSIWTLAYEFSYYLMVMLLAFISIFKRRWIIFIVFACFFAMRIYTIYGEVPPKIFYFLIYTDLQLDYFSEFGLFFTGGVIMYLYKHKLKLSHGVACIIVVAYLISMYVELPWLLKYIAFPYLILYLAFIPKCKVITDWGQKTDFSYGIYIYGMPVQQSLIAVIGITAFPDLFSVLCVLVLIPIAWVSWHYIEKPLLRAY